MSTLSRDLHLEPSSWAKAGRAYLDEARDLRTNVAARLATLDVERLGCTRGEHPADAVLALVVPPVRDAFAQAVDHLAGNLERVGAALQATGVDYAANEDEQTAASGAIEGVL